MNWRRSAGRLLRKRGYDAKRIAGMTRMMLDFALLLPWFGFLFED